VIDAAGKTVVPGLIETHVHAIGAARGEVLQPFAQLHSIKEIQDWVRTQAQKIDKAEWIQVPRVDVTRIKERRIPTRKDLDEAAPDRPVVFNWQYANRQVQVLNSAALKAAGITKDTRPPAPGKVRFGDDGEPTGVLEDAGSLVSKFLARRTVPEAEHLDSLVRLLRRYNEVGITSIGAATATSPATASTRN
jgi:predicted amidohydrolase YtcJ